MTKSAKAEFERAARYDPQQEYAPDSGLLNQITYQSERLTPGWTPPETAPGCPCPANHHPGPDLAPPEPEAGS